MTTDVKSTEKIYVTPDTKRALMQLRQPHERYGDVVARILRERKREDLIAYLDRISQEDDVVPLDNDPEFAAMKQRKR